MVAPDKIKRLLRRVVRIMVVIGLCAFAGLAILMGGLWVDHHQTTILLAPTGQFAVGRITYDWRDPSQQELLAPREGIPREIFAWIWYPASAPTSAVRVAYLPPAWRNAMNRQRGWLLTEFMWRDFSRVRAHSFEAPPLAAGYQRYPVLLMRAGLPRRSPVREPCRGFGHSRLCSCWFRRALPQHSCGFSGRKGCRQNAAK